MFIVTILVLLVVCHQVHCFYGLIGGIGSGKSVAAQLFAEQNWVVADVDVFNRTCLLLPQVQNKIRKRWSDLPHEASLQRLWLRRQLLTNEGDRVFRNAAEANGATTSHGLGYTTRSTKDSAIAMGQGHGLTVIWFHRNDSHHCFIGCSSTTPRA